MDVPVVIDAGFVPIASIEDIRPGRQVALPAHILKHAFIGTLDAEVTLVTLGQTNGRYSLVVGAQPTAAIGIDPPDLKLE